MLYCFDSKLKRDYSKREMKLAKEMSIGILYDSDLNEFIDFFGKKVDIAGKVIFPRTGAKQVYDMNREIINRGGIPILTNSQIDSIMDWPVYYKTRRKTEIIKGKELINPKNIEQIEHEYGSEIFIKTKDKNFSSIVPVSILKDKNCVFYKTLEYHLEDEFIISEKVHIESDIFGLKEYRCFVINNELFNISRYTDDVLHPIGQSVLDKALEVIDKVKGGFPNCYVFDLFEYSKNGKAYIDVVEFNPISSSGLYLYNSVISQSTDILHTNVKNIPLEFLDMLSHLKTEGTMLSHPSNLYNIMGTFANDLRSIFLIGVRGIVFAFDIELTIECMAKRINNQMSDNSLISNFFGEDVSEVDSDEIQKEQVKQKKNSLF